MSRALPIIDCPPALDDDAGFGCLRGPQGALPLTACTADLTVVGPVWRWALRQTFRNSARDAIEAVYIFPLPPRGAVSAFRLRVAGRVVEGDLQERGAARATYQQAIRRGQRAALLEEERPNVFTIQVGNLQPGEQAEVELELSGPVAVEDGFASVRLPLVVAPRYIPGRALGDDVGAGTAGDTDAVPDASRISPPVLLPGFPNPVRLAISLSVSGLDDAEVGCSLPTVADGPGRWRVLPGQRLDRDCIVRWKARGERLALRALAAPAAADGGTTLALSVIPPAAQAVAQPQRDVVVLLDRSGSMQGWKMVAARRAAARLIDALDARDRFAALAFDDAVEGHDGGALRLHPATDRTRFNAVAWLGGIESRGGTEMTGALDSAFALLPAADDGRERILVLVTDAQIGDEDRLLKRHAAALRRTRVVALGIDQAVNEALLERLVAPNGGWQACVESEDWLDRVLAVAARMVQPPALADIVVEGEDGPLPACSPDPIPDAWCSRPLTLWARLSATLRQVTVRGTLADGRAWRQEVAVEPVAEPALHAAWARARIRDLEDRHAIAANAETANEIVRISLAERVLSRFTAFVAVDREIAGKGRPRTVVQPVALPAGWEEQVDAEAAPPPTTCASVATFACAAPIAAKKLAAPGGGGTRGGGLRRSMRVREETADLCCEESGAVPAQPAPLAAALLARLQKLAGDQLRLALALRAGRTGDELRALREALAADPGHATLVKRLDQVLARLAPPATMAAVADCWPDLRPLLAEIAALPAAAAATPRKRSRFWG